MAGRVQGKVAFITGAARGQGRSHAIRLAEEGADIIAVDVCASIESVPYPLATPDDLAETVRAVESLDRRIVSTAVDVRDADGLRSALEKGVAELGRLDIVIANAGVAAMSVRPSPNAWRDVIDINLTGVFNTVEAASPTLVEQGTGGAIVLTSSTAGIMGIGGAGGGGLGYTASKHGVVGLMRSYANLLAAHSIRVNSVHPTGVNTMMINNEAMREFFSRDAAFAIQNPNALPVPMIEPVDVSNAILWLVSDEARYITGVALPVDAGYINKK